MADSEMTLGAFPAIRSEETDGPAPVSVNRSLVERCVAGDEDAFGTIYRSFAPMVHGVLMSRLPREEVSDAVQDVFLSAYKNLRSLRDPDALGGWLVKIARNHIVDHYRERRPTDELPEHLQSRDSRKAEADEIMAAIRSLPTAYRETLVLRLVEGMSGAEIAVKTGMSPDSVRVNLHRGMNLLRKKLGIAGGRK